MYHQSLSKDGCNVSTYFPSVITRNKWYSMIIHVQKKRKNGGGGGGGGGEVTITPGLVYMQL